MISIDDDGIVIDIFVKKIDHKEHKTNKPKDGFDINIKNVRNK